MVFQIVSEARAALLTMYALCVGGGGKGGQFGAA
jgi:hypothetical protein